MGDTKKVKGVSYLRGDRFPGYNKYKDNQHTWLVLLCHHNQPSCREYAKVWELANRQIQPLVKVGAVDCSKPANGRLCQMHAQHNEQTVLRIGGPSTPKNGKFSPLKPVKKKQTKAAQLERLARFAFSGLPPPFQPVQGLSQSKAGANAYELHNVRTPQHLQRFLEQCRQRCAAHQKERCECILSFSSKYDTTPHTKAIAYSAHLANRPLPSSSKSKRVSKSA